MNAPAASAARMRLFEAILDANRRRIVGDATARIPVAEFTTALPIAALTCIDVRLNHLLPDSLGVPEEHFIWLRNAGNIITSPLSSTMRSLALACAVKGAKEIAVIGHSDCQVGHTTMLQLLDRLNQLGIDRHRLPENLVEYFGLFGSERQNVTRGVELVRASPLIGPRIPVHGLMIELETGKLDWVVNGYDSPIAPVPGKVGELLGKADQAVDKLVRIGNLAAEEFKLPTGKIGEIASVAQDWVHKAEQAAAAVVPQTTAPAGTPSKPGPPTGAPDPLETLQKRMRRFTAARPNSPTSHR